MHVYIYVCEYNYVDREIESRVDIYLHACVFV